MLALNADADFLQLHHHFVTQVILGVNRRTGEVAFLMARFVAQVGELFTAGVPCALDRVDHVEGLVGAGIVADFVKDEEFSFRTKEGGVADTGRFEISLCLAGDVARIAGIIFFGDRIEYVADQRQGRDGDERIHLGGGRIRQQDHVGSMDRLPSAN